MAAIPSTSASSGLLTLSESDVAAVLDDLPAAAILASVGQALSSFSSHQTPPKQGEVETPQIQNPLRLSVTTPRHTMLFMPSRLGVQATTSIKVVSVPRSDNDKTGLLATTLIFDEDTGSVRAVMNARALTAVRTAAASALALSLSPNAQNAERLLIFGSGLQALWHAKLVASLSPVRLTRVTIACRALNSRASSLVAELQAFFAERNIDVRMVTIAEATAQGGEVESADLVCCCTPSTTPLFSGSRLKRGAGLSLIGSYKSHMREVDLVPLFAPQATSDSSSPCTRLIVDSRSACLAEAGELHHLFAEAGETVGNQGEKVLVELGELLSEDGRAREASGADADETVVFKCVGMGVMDSAISASVLAHAEKRGLGWTVDF